MNIDTLKTTFPKYRITDASNRTNDEIVKISSICCSNKNILVVIERNSKNNEYFDFIEMIDRICNGDIKYIIFNEDNYYYHTSLSNAFILHVKRILDHENECPICFEQCFDNYFFCSQCATICCLPCYSKCENKICSICRCDKFSTFGFGVSE